MDIFKAPNIFLTKIAWILTSNLNFLLSYTLLYLVSRKKYYFNLFSPNGSGRYQGRILKDYTPVIEMSNIFRALWFFCDRASTVILQQADNLRDFHRRFYVVGTG